MQKKMHTIDLYLNITASKRDQSMVRRSALVVFSSVTLHTSSPQRL